MFINLSDKIVTFIKVPSKFFSFFSEEEIKRILRDYFPNAYNSNNVRLEGIHFKNGMYFATLSKTDFFSLLCSNIIYRKKLLETVDKEKILLFKKNNVNDMSVLDNNFFSNNLAVSVLISDTNNKYLLVKRASSLAIGANYFGVSVTGGIDDVDLESNDPFRSAVIREVLEELNIDVKPKDIIINGIYIGSEKLQPIVICRIYLKKDIIISDILNGKDSLKENEEFFLYSKDDLLKINNYTMTEAAKFQIELEIKG